MNVLWRLSNLVVPWATSLTQKISVEIALALMVMEDMIHYGELTVALWQMGLEGPYLGFWRFKSTEP